MYTHLLSERSDLTASEAAAVADFVSRLNGGELVPLVNLFAADAQVNDQLRNFWGLDAITDWLEREIVGEHVKLSVRSARKHYDTVILEAEMSGDFSAAGAPQPLGVDLYFTVQSEKIVRLLVLLARHDTTEPEVRRLL